MLNIFATTFMTATRSPCVRLHEVPAPDKAGKRRWFNRRKTVCIDPMNL